MNKLKEFLIAAKDFYNSSEFTYDESIIKGKYIGTTKNKDNGWLSRTNQHHFICPKKKYLLIKPASSNLDYYKLKPLKGFQFVFENSTYLLQWEHLRQRKPIYLHEDIEESFRIILEYYNKELEVRNRLAQDVDKIIKELNDD